MTFIRNRCKMALELTKAVTGLNDKTTLMDKLTSQTPLMPRAREWGLELGFFNYSKIYAPTSILSVRVEAKPTSSGVMTPDVAPVLLKDVSAAAFNTALTQDEWDNDEGDTPYHVIVPFTAAETGISMVGHTNNVLTLGLVITAVTTTGVVTVGAGYLQVINDGGRTSVDGPAVGPETYLTAGETLAALAAKVNLGWNPAGSWYGFQNADGWGIRVGISEGANPSLEETTVQP